jgi:branched-chain amino acid aminotransferase
MALVPMDDRDGMIWFDGELKPWRDAKIHVLTHALHYGSCVFEGQRVYGGKVFKLSDHSARLHKSAQLLGFEIPYSVAELDRACEQVVAANKLTDAYMRPVAWRGSEQMGVAAQQTKIHVAIAAWDWGSYFSEELRERGIRLTWARWRRPAPDTAPCASKAAGLYMICTMSKHEAEAAGFHDALMLDYRGRLSEATGANLFVVKDGKIHTPVPDCFLDGITRRTVMDLARARGIEVIERPMWPYEIATADELFLTGSAAEVTAVGEVDGHHLQVGPITRALRDDYAALVRGELKAAAA